MQRQLFLFIAIVMSFAIALVSLLWVQRRIPFRPAQEKTRLAGEVDFDALFENITGERLQQLLKRVVRRPSRLSGSVGDVEVSEWVEQRLRSMGMQVVRQTFPVTVPVTKWCRITHADGQAFEDVTLAPFWPNIVRTCTTPAEGIVGTVIDGGSGSFEDLDGKQVRGNIVLLRCESGFAWLDAAKLGAEAILFRPTLDPDAFNGKILKFPANMPRFLVSGPAQNLIGKRVKIRARVDWQIQQARNVFGVMRPEGGGGTQAVTLLAHTDSWSMVPDQAPGYHDGCAVACLMGMAEALHHQRHQLKKTVVFGALSGHYQASAGSRRITDALGDRDKLTNPALLEMRRRTLEQRQGDLQSVVSGLSGHQDWAVGAAHLKKTSPAAYKALAATVDQMIYRYTIRTQQKADAAKLAWVSEGRPDSEPSFERYRDLSRNVRRANNAQSADLLQMKRYFPNVLVQAQKDKSIIAAVKESLLKVQADMQTLRDAFGVAELFGPMDENYFFFIAPSSIDPQLGFRGRHSVSMLCRHLEGTRDAVVRRWLNWGKATGEGLAPGDYYMVNLVSNRLNQSFSSHPLPASDLTIGPDITLTWAGNSAFSFRGRVFPASYRTPLDRQVDIEALRIQTQLLAGLTAQLVASEVPLRSVGQWSTYFSDFGGQVATTNVSNALMPSQQVVDALVVLKGAYGSPMYLQLAPDGFYRFPAVEANIADWLMVDAYTFDQDTGRLTGARDMGPDGERFPTLKFKHGHAGVYGNPETRVTVPLARLAPMDLYRTLGANGHPLTIDLRDARFGTPPARYSISEYWEQGATVFLPSGEPFYLVLKNQKRRFFGKTGSFVEGFMDGRKLDGRAAIGQDLWGPGYLAGQDYRAIFQEVDAALSTAGRNRYSLNGQIESGVADPVSVALADRAETLLRRGLDGLAERQYTDAYRDLTGSLAISTRAHPAVESAVHDAVNGILLYLFLLVPFSYCAERLLFDFSDIRIRLVGVFMIFLLVFALIRFTHPAYDLISSSMVVLIGFVILMLCILILGFIMGKFTDRIRALRRRGGGMTQADDAGSRLGASSAAFNLGISNMRKHRVRTAYTVATLVLISFCLVCFTAPRPHLKDHHMAVGSAGFNGMVLRQPGDIAAARQRFNQRGQVIARWAHKAGLTLSYINENGRMQHAKLGGTVAIQPDEAVASGIDKLLISGDWFTDDDQEFCYISDVTADKLGIDPIRVGQKDVRVTLMGRKRRVFGVFDSKAVDALRDADGQHFLPELSSLLSAKDRERERVKGISGQSGATPGQVRYVPASDVALLPMNLRGSGRFTSAVVLFNDQPHNKMHELISSMLDRTPTFIRYAIDGVAFFGARLRSVGLEGYVDIVVPLLVATCIVFNTMLGNVHERTKEISIYSAIGLSPRHVFYLFLAESLVYAVIGVVGGYLMALGLQWLSQQSGGAFGLTIDYSSRSAIYVSITLMLAVISSSVVPAYRAARVASPSERVSWVLPTPVAPGRLRFELPFSYRGLDIVATAAFLTRWFDSHGEDASGPFMAESPQVKVDWSSEHRDTPVFRVYTTVWPRPYDLGVSQNVRLSIEPSAEPSIYMIKVGIDLLTGGDNSWRRTNARFVRLLRSYLLSWRNHPPATKHHFFEVASQMLDSAPSWKSDSDHDRHGSPAG